MLKINRLKIKIETENGLYGVDEEFSSGLNFLASRDNTCGKSSILEAIYYGLGFEEIIGGKGEKVLTSAYKTFIEDGEQKLVVLSSKVYLEISNGEEVITIYRAAKMEHRDSRLITVYYSDFENIDCEDTLIEDMYVLMPNAATNLKGFHRFLEDFLHLELPMVPTTDGGQRKLYLQLIFSCMFIEQKHGWGDIFSGMPYLGVKEAKKRVIEYVLNLDTLSNEKKKERLKIQENKIKNSWDFHVRELINASNRETCRIVGVPFKPGIITSIDLSAIDLFKNDLKIEEFLLELKSKYRHLEEVKPKVIDNFEELQNELNEIEEDIRLFENKLEWLREQILRERTAIQVLNDNLEVIENDLRNNKDAAKLRNLGSKLDCMTSKSVCPVCQREIDDTLLPVIDGTEIMSIDENIRHLEAQKVMLNYSKESHQKNRDEMDGEMQELSGKIFSLRRLAKAIRSDLYSVDESVSEAVVYKKIDVQSRIERIERLINLVDEKKSVLQALSAEWEDYLSNREKLPRKYFSKKDEEKLKKLKSIFVSSLKQYGYKSVVNLQDISISEETYLPVIEEFDMKFDSSASDNIRGIWAYTVALMQVSMEDEGNHPRVLIFDEPNQHSIIPEDMEKFFGSIVKLGNHAQTIVGITVKDSDTKNIIGKIEEGTYKLIEVKNKAFQKLD